MFQIPAVVSENVRVARMQTEQGEDKHHKSLLFTTLMPWLLTTVWRVFAVLIHIFHPQGGGV